LGGVVALVPQVVEQVVGVDAAAGVTVDPLESGVGSEISDVAEALAEALKVSLAISNGDEDSLKSLFRFVVE